MMETISQLELEIIIFISLVAKKTTSLWDHEIEGPVESISISSNGSYIVAGSSDKKLYLFHYTSSVPLWTYQATDTWYPVSISSDSKYIATGNGNCTYLFGNYNSITVDGSIDENRDDGDSDDKDGDNTIPFGSSFLFFIIVTLIIITSYKKRELNSR